MRGVEIKIHVHAGAGDARKPGLVPNGTHFVIIVAITLRVMNAKGHVLWPASLGE